MEGLCILLRRLAYPNRLSDLEPLFGLSAVALSGIINHMVDTIFVNKGHLLGDLRNIPYLDEERLNEFSQVKIIHVLTTE